VNKHKIRRTILQEYLKDEKTYIVPGCANALDAKLIEEAGFEMIFVTGAGISNAQLGIADLGLLTMTEIVAQVNYISDITGNVPIIADADTGYGNQINVIRTVKELEKVGVSAIMIEDQSFPKRCGHFSGKEVISTQEMVGKIKAATDAREDQNLAIIARTDSNAIYGIDDALERAHAYREAGADVTFVEAALDKYEMSRIGALKWPQLTNMVEGGRTPLLSKEELNDLGFKLVYYANSILRASILATQNLLSYLKNHGSTIDIQSEMVTWEERQRIMELAKYEKISKKYE